jgi:hypothetical protein
MSSLIQYHPSTYKYPKIPGIEDFGGKLMHSAAWDGNYDLNGKTDGYNRRDGP